MEVTTELSLDEILGQIEDNYGVSILNANQYECVKESSFPAIELMQEFGSIYIVFDSGETDLDNKYSANAIFNLPFLNRHGNTILLNADLYSAEDLL